MMSKEIITKKFVITDMGIKLHGDDKLPTAYVKLDDVAVKWFSLYNRDNKYILKSKGDRCGEVDGLELFGIFVTQMRRFGYSVSVDIDEMILKTIPDIIGKTTTWHIIDNKPFMIVGVD